LQATPTTASITAAPSAAAANTADGWGGVRSVYEPAGFSSLAPRETIVCHLQQQWGYHSFLAHIILRGRYAPIGIGNTNLGKRRARILRAFIRFMTIATIGHLLCMVILVFLAFNKT
jgi:hypothetical protein